MSIIIVSDVSKKFILHHEKNTTLKEKLIYRNRSSNEDFWALRNVSCQIEKGTTVGLIGRNGSGKSTLLKMMSKIIYPTSGSIQVNGRVSSLLELGAGFHPDFTGRENIYMNASILGFSKREIDQKLDAIIAFSELENFIDNPLRSYSSGMYMRLAFSVAISVDPDLLLIDEILSVGDTSFQKKCINRLMELKKQKKTIVIVSHDNQTLERLCDTAIWLNNGEIYKVGDAKLVINEYLDFMAEEQGRRQQQEQGDNKPSESEDSQEQVEEKTENRWGNGLIQLKKVEILDSNDNERYVFSNGEMIQLRLHYKMKSLHDDVVFGFRITTPDGINCFGTNTYIDGFPLDGLSQEGSVTCSIDSIDLVEGTYLLDIAIHQKDGTAFDYYCGGYSFQVKSNVHDTGIAKLKHNWLVS